MPTLRKDKGNRWMGRVVVHGRQVMAKVFAAGKKYGPEWREAKEWEEEQLKLVLSQTVIPTGYERLLAWADTYLDHAGRTMTHSTHVEKRNMMQVFFKWCGQNNVGAIEDITPPKAYAFLSMIWETKNASVANKYRKNLMAAWKWGVDFCEGFPQTVCPFYKVQPFPVDKKDRYVPPEEDLIKVLQQAEGQDLVMLLTMYFTGARRGEIFRLKWEDVLLQEGKIRLVDHKAGHGQRRVRWLQMHPELVKALSWWYEARPCKVENVFMQLHCDSTMGEPFTQRLHFMRRLCNKAGVKPFGFHAIRHKSAGITFVGSGLNAAQILMGHYRATTTDRYTKNAGLYADQGEILTALGSSKVGQAAGSLLNEKIPQDSGTISGENVTWDL